MLKPIKMYYVTTKDETTILYNTRVYPGKKIQEKSFTFKGKFQQKPTVYNVTKFLEGNLSKSL